MDCVTEFDRFFESIVIFWFLIFFFVSNFFFELFQSSSNKIYAFWSIYWNSKSKRNHHTVVFCHSFSYLFWQLFFRHLSPVCNRIGFRISTGLIRQQLPFDMFLVQIDIIDIKEIHAWKKKLTCSTRFKNAFSDSETFFFISGTFLSGTSAPRSSGLLTNTDFSLSCFCFFVLCLSNSLSLICLFKSKYSRSFNGIFCSSWSFLHGPWFAFTSPLFK